MSTPTVVVLILVLVVIIWLWSHRIISRRKAKIEILPEAGFNPSNSIFRVVCTIEPQKQIALRSVVADFLCEASWELEGKTGRMTVLAKREEEKVDQILLPGEKKQYSFEFQGPFPSKRPSLTMLNSLAPTDQSSETGFPSKKLDKFGKNLDGLIEKIEQHPLTKRLSTTRGCTEIEYNWRVRIWLDCKGVDCLEIIDIYKEIGT
jgi:hypothetical protein